MKFVEFKGELPKFTRQQKHNEVQNMLMELLNTNIKVAKVDYGSDYICPVACHGSLRLCCKRNGFPLM